MNVTVCELEDGWFKEAATWNRLIEHVGNENSDFVLLPEMPFSRWLARTKDVDSEQWRLAVESHGHWIDRLSELPASVVVGTRPVIEEKNRYNEGFIWERGTGYKAVHRKFYLPNEKGFWEASWYQRGDGDFKVVDVNGIKIGFLICTELWFNSHARDYCKQGIHLLVCPRVTPLASIDRWITGGRTAAIVSGAFCLSSNLNGPNVEGIDFGGTGWIIEPEGGDVLGFTDSASPFLTMEIDLAEAEKAKKTYPRYVIDAPF